MANIHTFRDDSGGKALVDVSSDVQPTAVRNVVCTVVRIDRPLKFGPVQGNAQKVPQVGDVLAITEVPATRPRIVPWGITPGAAKFP